MAEKDWFKEGRKLEKKADNYYGNHQGFGANPKADRIKGLEGAADFYEQAAQAYDKAGEHSEASHIRTTYVGPYRARAAGLRNS